MNTAGDRLLYVLSSRGEIAWNSFRTIVDNILVEELASNSDLPSVRRHLIKSLDALGHCDIGFVASAGRIHVAPPVLYFLPMQDRFVAVAAGLRSPSTWSRLQDSCSKLDQISLAQRLQDMPFEHLLPPQYTVEASSSEQLEALAKSAKFRFQLQPAAWRFVHFAAGLDSYKERCQLSIGTELNWRRADFDPEYQVFWTSKAKDRPLRLSRYLRPKQNTFHYRLWSDDKWAEVDPDWGRYWILNAHGFDVLYHDKENSSFAFPVTAPVPRLLQRSLALCSGLAGKILSLKNNHKDFVVYSGVPEEIALLVASKLGQSLMRCQLSHSFEEKRWTIQ